MEPRSIPLFLPPLYCPRAPKRMLAPAGKGGRGSRHQQGGSRASALLWAVAAVGFLVAWSPASQAVGSALSGGRSAQGLLFVGGADSSAACASYPCGSVVSRTGEEAQVSFSLGIESEDDLQPATYYTDLLMLTNTSPSSVTLMSVSVQSVSETRPGDLGRIEVYYCRAQTDEPWANCQGALGIVSKAGGTVYAGDDVMSPGSARYIEFAGFAGPSAAPGDQVSFTVGVTTE